MSRNAIPKITWNGNTLEFGWPLDRANAYELPLPGTETAVASAGVRDSWVTGHEYRLSGAVRWIPASDATGYGSVPQTGWNGAAGWQAFLEWAREMNQFAFFPDRDAATSIPSKLVEPMRDKPGLEGDGRRRIDSFEIVSTDGSKYTGY